eukprot:3653715-Pleurochrysis_carterae.AAC.1
MREHARTWACAARARLPHHAACVRSLRWRQSRPARGGRARSEAALAGSHADTHAHTHVHI